MPRHVRGLLPEVFPSSALSTDIAGSPGSSGKAPGEVTAGSRELHALPWRSLGVIAVAALVGNVMASVIMGTSYEGADSLYPVARSLRLHRHHGARAPDG